MFDTYKEDYETSVIEFCTCIRKYYDYYVLL